MARENSRQLVGREWGQNVTPKSMFFQLSYF